MSSLTTALLAEMSESDLDQLAELLAPRLAPRLTDTTTRTGWLDVDQAAEHLACPKSRLYALTSTRRIPHQRDGSRLLFDRNELDEWVRAGGAKRT